MKIEINIGKKHFWAIIGVIVLLAITTIVVAKTTTPAYTNDQPFHETLYTDVIAGKTTTKVMVDDDTEVTGDAKFDKNVDVTDSVTAKDVVASDSVTAKDVIVGDKLTLGGVAKDSWPKCIRVGSACGLQCTETCPPDYVAISAGCRASGQWGCDAHVDSDNTVVCVAPQAMFACVAVCCQLEY